MRTIFSLKKTAELGVALAAVGVLTLAGCGGGGGGSTTAAAANNTAGNSCAATTLSAAAPGAVNGNFGTVSVTGTGATVFGSTYAPQSLSYGADPFAQFLAWADVPTVTSGASQVLATSNAKVVFLTLNKTTNAPLSITVETLGATGAATASWFGSTSAASGVLVDVLSHTATFTNVSVPGGFASGVGTALTLNGHLCLN